MKKKYTRLLSLLAMLLVAVSLATPIAQAAEKSTDMETPRYLSTDEVIKLTQYHIDGYMATDFQTMGRDIMASEQFVNLYDTNDNLFAYMVPLMENGANIGYITMPAKNSGATFYEIFIGDGVVDDVKNCTTSAVGTARNAIDTKLYFLPPYNYILAINEADNTSFYELHSGNTVEMIDISNSFSLSMGQTTYAAQDEVVNQKIMNILQPVHTRATTVTVEDVPLKQESNFVHVASTYYGGDQAWYAESSQQSNGCGPVAAANITYYLDKQSKLAISGLYSYLNISKSNFTKHMNTLYSYCDPGVFGETSLTNWTDDVVAYATDCGVSLSPAYTSLSGTFENSCTYIKNGLRKDSPVATLNLDKLWSQYGWHWMTITKYYRGTADDRYVAVSTWGERHSLNYETLYDKMTGIFGGGLMYFT